MSVLRLREELILLGRLGGNVGEVVAVSTKSYRSPSSLHD